MPAGRNKYRMNPAIEALKRAIVRVADMPRWTGAEFTAGEVEPLAVDIYHELNTNGLIIKSCTE